MLKRIERFVKTHRIDLIFLTIFIGLLAFAYRRLLSDISGSLMDRYDFPYIVWVVNSNIQNILHGNLAHYFDTRGFYPHPYGLLFSDILLPQSLLVLPIYLLTRNIILSFNSILLFTFVLNYCAAYLFWKYFTKNSFFAFLGAILTVFGPFYHIQMAHFQMQSYWLSLFSMYFLSRSLDENNKKFALISGLLLGIQFTASVYHFVFFSVFSGIVVMVSFFTAEKKKHVVHMALLKYILMALVIFPFVKAYYAMKAYYGMSRDIEEIILYEAHMTDYLFTSAYKSAFYSFPEWARWNIFDKHVIGEKTVFPGFVLVGLSLLGFFSQVKSSTYFLVQFVMTRLSVIFGLLGVVGFIGSLGPRLSFNGAYAHIPTPYYAALKLFPLIDAIRSPARWSVLLYVSMVYFSLMGLQKLYHYGRSRFTAGYMSFLALTVFLIICIEYLPVNLTVEKVPEVSTEYLTLQKICSKEDKVVLEYPITHFTASGGIVEGLSYISRVQLAQVSHNCSLMNGYSGFIPSEVFKTESDLNTLIGAGNEEGLQMYMEASNIDIIKLNQNNTLIELRPGFEKIKEAIQNDSDFMQLSPILFELRAK